MTTAGTFESGLGPEKNRFRRVARALESAFSCLGRRGGAMRACRRGATAVEFALVAPVFLAMTMGVVEMGRALWIKATMQHAVELTTRYYMVNNSISDADLVTYATARLGESGMDTGNFAIAAADVTIGGTSYMAITITHAFTAIVEIVKFPAVTLTAQARVPDN